MESSSSEVTDSESKNDSQSKQDPICVIILGMAGSGKSSVCSKMVEYLFGKNIPPYVVNCDPACLSVDYFCNVDIRDSVNYKNVMEKYQLGPNGSIITSINLFATRFDQVLQLIDKRKESHQ